MLVKSNSFNIFQEIKLISKYASNLVSVTNAYKHCDAMLNTRKVVLVRLLNCQAYRSRLALSGQEILKGILQYIGAEDRTKELKKCKGKT